MTTALSARNPKVQRLRRLSTKRADRGAERAFVVEGWKLVGEAIDAGVAIDALFVDPTSEGRAPRHVAPVYVVEARVLAGALDTTAPQGIAAIAQMPPDRTPALDAAGGPVLVLVGVNDPGNAGTLLRTAEAAACSAVLFVDDSVDAYAPKCVRASAGSIFRISVVNDGQGVDVLEQLASRGVRRLGTSAHDGAPYDEADLTVPFALVLGSEAHGLPDPVAAALDDHVHVPMAGAVESLNVGVAGSVVLLEAARQRRRARR